MTGDKTSFTMKKIRTNEITRKISFDSYYVAFSNTLKLLREINNTLPQLAANDLAATKADLSRRIQELHPEGKKQYDKYEEFSKNYRKRKLMKVFLCPISNCPVDICI